jgi:hypothetical protein
MSKYRCPECGQSEFFHVTYAEYGTIDGDTGQPMGRGDGYHVLNDEYDCAECGLTWSEQELIEAAEDQEPV